MAIGNLPDSPIPGNLNSTTLLPLQYTPAQLHGLLDRFHRSKRPPTAVRRATKAALSEARSELTLTNNVVIHNKVKEKDIISFIVLLAVSKTMAEQTV